MRIPDFLALVGDTADGYPGLDGVGKATAAKLVNKYGAIETFPPDVLGEQQELALKFKELATLKADLPLFSNVDELRWTGPTAEVRRLGHCRRRRQAAGARAEGQHLSDYAGA